MGNEADLSLKAVLEAVLDAKGFDDFKKKVEEAAQNAKESGKGAGAASGDFDRLGKLLPKTGFALLSREMLRNAGVQGALGPLTRISTGALESLAAAGKLTTTSLAGATLGLSLLIPLLAMMASKSSETADATVDVKEDTDTLIDSYEALRAKGVQLTRTQEQYLAVLREIQKEERRTAEESIEAQIAQQEKLIKSTLSLWGATKLFVSGMIDHQIKGKEFVSLEDRMAAITDKAREEIERLGTQLEALKEAHDEGYKSAGDHARAELEAAEKAEIAARKARDAAAKVAEYHLTLGRQLASERAALNVEAAQTTADRMRAISEQEAGILEDRLHDAIKAGATDAEIQEMRALSYKKALMRIRAEEEKWQKDRDKMIADGIAKNKEEAQAVLANIEMTRQMEEQAQRDKEARFAQNVNLAQAGAALLTTVFGKSKGVAIAQAIVDTYASAAMALKNPPGPPWSLVYVALAIATGLKQVQAIRNAKPESGFDDPVNDMLARNYGRRWASDFLREVGRGFVSELRDSFSRGGTVINQSTRIDRGTHIQNANFNGLLGTPGQAMSSLNRQLIKVGRVEDRTRRRSSVPARSKL